MKVTKTVDVKKLKAEVIVDERDLEMLGTDEREHVREYVRMFKRLRSLAKKLERDCLEQSGGRGVYALCTVYSQQREVIADIRTLTDLSGQVQMLDEQVLQPFTRSVGQQVLNVYYQLRRLITETTEKKQTQFALDKLEEITKDLSSVLQSQYEESSVRVSDLLMGPMQQPVIPVRKKKSIKR
jgi:hypothetical protein